MVGIKVCQEWAVHNPHLAPFKSCVLLGSHSLILIERLPSGGTGFGGGHCGLFHYRTLTTISCSFSTTEMYFRECTWLDFVVFYLAVYCFVCMSLFMVGIKDCQEWGVYNPHLAPSIFCVFTGMHSALNWVLPGGDTGFGRGCSGEIVLSGHRLLHFDIDSLIKWAMFSQPSNYQSVAIVVCFITDS